MVPVCNLCGDFGVTEVFWSVDNDFDIFDGKSQVPERYLDFRFLRLLHLDLQGTGFQKVQHHIVRRLRRGRLPMGVPLISWSVVDVPQVAGQ